MLNHINVRYSTTGDFTFLNPSVYVPINKTYNLILLPINEESKDLMALEPSDTIKLFNKNEIVSIYIETLTQLSILQKYNNDLVNNYNYIYSENKRLQEDINNKNSQIAELVKDKVDEVN